MRSILSFVLALAFAGCNPSTEGAGTMSPEELDARLICDRLHVKVFVDFDGDQAGEPGTASCETSIEPGTIRANRGTDCDDTDARIRPDAPEIVNDGVDQNCDGGEDCLPDYDQDGFAFTGDGSTHYPQIYSADLVCGNYGDEATADDLLGDCNDVDPDINPDADDLPNDGIDQNCNDMVDEDPSILIDEDEDGAYAFEDCDDFDASRYPDAAEILDSGVDEDCDGFEDCYFDGDEDGYFVVNEAFGGWGPYMTISSIDMDCDDQYEGDSSSLPDDCDDTRRRVNPGRIEVTDNGRDDDCDASTPD